MAKKKGAYKSKDIEARAISIVKQEKIRWEMATAFVTDRVAFKMRELIRILRKNYYGVFDAIKDPQTGLEKVWYPLTEINVEAVVKNIDLDQKDLQFRAKTPNGYEITEVTRAAVRDKLSKMYFGQKLDDFERYLCIDGTAVWKTYEEDGKMVLQQVDLLNIYIDPTTPSIQQAYRFTERSLMFPEQIMGMTGWMNTEGIDKNVVEGLPRTDPYWMNRSSMINSNIRMIDVYELWGKIPKSLLTGEKSDDEIEVDGHMVVSGIDTPGNERCLLIEENTKKDAEGNTLKPYEECWYTRVPNRWYGRGIAEKLMVMQIYANMVFNFRINRSRISQLGLFKVRKGSGITPQMLSQLPGNGAVVLNNLDDLQQFVVSDVTPVSYKDEDVINSLSERLTSAFEVVTGESMPASTPATNAVIQNQNAKTAFTMVKDAIGGFLTRWMDRHALPIIAKELTTGEVVRITADLPTYKALVDRIVLNQTMKALEDSFERGHVPSQQQVQSAMESAHSKLSKSDLFVKLVRDVIASELDTEVFVTNEEMDVAVTVQNLISMMNYAPEYKDAIVKQTFDLMGLAVPTLPPQQQPAQSVPGLQQGQQQMPQINGLGAGPLPMPKPSMINPQKIATGAMTNVGRATR